MSMQAKDYFMHEHNLEKSIYFEKEKLAYLQSSATKCTRTLNTVGGSSSSKDIHSKEDVMLDIVMQKEKIDALQKEYNDLEKRINAIIDSIESPLYRAILQYRYQMKLKWDVIQKKLSYSRSAVMKYHAKALVEFETKMSTGC